ncbi:ABC transporter ATP-binding protein [Xylanibacillus composti]|uniref:Multidrug ABC transporter ATP-binding protein n=1 Tax=Xylanibacillus composti TaxID=1572762 RepID=A0A8J4H773_9BACL|nr:ABC transporter ATP-binding protein [Xylanibacillus composti]MDT9726890.1 ABC transporter ATP-binding protein [Xylanibacillus composti]GIQ69798.1 multidrug ABC transporter ATP-binding protein [Xylanibacillus composti]
MRKLLVYLKPFRGFVALVLLFVFLQSLSELYLPTLMADLVNNGVQVGDTPYILKMGGWMLLVAALGAICMILGSYYSAMAASGFGRDLRSKLFTHVSSFSQQEFDQVGTASLITRTTNDITQVQQVLIMIMRMMIAAPMMAIGGIIMALWKDTTLALVIIGVMPILALAIFLIARKGVPLFKAIQIKLDKVNLVQREGLTGIRVIRAFNRTEHEQRRFEEANFDLTDTAVKVNRIMALMMPTMMLILNFSTVAILWFGGIRIDHGHMQVGDLMAFIQYAMMILFSLIMLSMIFVMLPRAAASAARIQEVLELSGSIHDAERPVEPGQGGTVEFRDVTFRYPGAEEPALRSISFEANPGEVTAIIGGTGSGKSTLISLIPRFYDVESGQVLVGGVDVREMTQASLRAKIGFVPQKAVLFSGTIADNIRYGKEDASDEEIRHAAATAQALDFIMEMEDGFEARISQGGTNVSGGQKQRLSIARALVCKPEIYVFDDSFSALDYKTDAKLRQALKAETGDATVIIVAQRVSSIRDADRIVVLEGGSVAGMGTHEELLQHNAVYQEIVASQLSEEEIA